MIWTVVHILAVGLWLGCLATEIAFEKAMAADAASRLWVSRLHDRVDRWIEGPVFVVVAVSGAVLALRTPLTPLLAVKIGLGVAAVAANVWCLRLVFDRRAAAEAGDWAAWAAIDRRQHAVGTAVTVLLLAATGVALVRATG